MPDHCVAHNNPTANDSWFNIDMVSKTVVHTVLIISREDPLWTADYLIGSDLYVGDNSDPKMNAACSALPQ